MIRILKKTHLLLLTAVLAFPSAANWQLEQSHSSVNFTTTKKGHIVENHYFDKVSADITSQGKVKLIIDLASVNTKIAIRDQRMKEHLFDTAVFPQATFTAQLNIKQLNDLAVSDSQVMDISGVVELHGKSQQVVTYVLVTKLANNKILVASRESLLINAQSFDLLAGINKLQELANLPSIGQTVPINFVLAFTAQ